MPMAQTITPTEQLVQALTEKGLPCCTGFPDTPLGERGDALFAAAAPLDIRMEAPIPLGDALAVPAVFSLQLRLYLPPHREAALLHRAAAEILLPAVFSLGWQVQELSIQELRYENRLDRLCLPVVLRAGGILHFSADEEVPENVP